jgi:alkaline phosphatase D
VCYIDTLSVRNGSALPYPSKPIHFQTFPDPRLHYGAKFRFIVTSCIKPNFPYAPLQGNRIKGFDLLAKYLWPDKVTASAHTGSDENSTNTEANLSDSHNDSEVVSAPLESFSSPAEFMLFLGDFVYADVPLYFGDNKEAYRRLYRRNYQSKSFRKVYERLRELIVFDISFLIDNLALAIIHAYDDHEESYSLHTIYTLC